MLAFITSLDGMALDIAIDALESGGMEGVAKMAGSTGYQSGLSRLDFSHFEVIWEA